MKSLTQDDLVLLAASFSAGPINRCSVESVFKKYRVKMPSNINRNVSNLVRNGSLEPQENGGQTTYDISDIGLNRIEEIESCGTGLEQAKPAVSPKLHVLTRISDSDEMDYVQEALKCYDVGACRATVVMVWSAVVHRLRLLVDAIGVPKFEQAYRKKHMQSKKKTANKLDDLAYFSDSELIETCEDLGILDRNEREILIGQALSLRNKCAHPGKYTIGQAKVEAYLEDIDSIVMAKEPLNRKNH